MTQPQIQEISLKILNKDTLGELSDALHVECNFCNKHVVLDAESSKLYEKMSGTFYCAFCLRHHFHEGISRHILPLTFRAIVGYYYYTFYKGNPNKLYWSEILEYLETHAHVGLRNPVFYYDPETYIWFIDFSRVGKGRGKISCDDVLKTILNILACFNLSLHIINIRIFELYNKYKEAIEKFYTQRSRPTDKKLVAPTLSGCGAIENRNLEIEHIKNFTSSAFVRKD